MTRQELDHQRYLSKQDERKAKQREYYQAHKEYYISRTVEWRRKQRKQAAVSKKQPPPTTEDLEAQLPLQLRLQLPRLRRDYLNIHITERPPYPKFLRDKTLEFYKQNANTL